MQNKNDLFLGSKFDFQSSNLSSQKRKEIEEWIVNSLKVKIIRKLENLLEDKGKNNLNKLMLIPVYSVVELTKRVHTFAPEMKTLYFKELIAIYDEAESRFT